MDDWVCMTQRPSETASVSVPRPARVCATDWTRLVATHPPTGVFKPARVSELPEAAARWLCGAVPPGTPLSRAAVLHMRGDIKLGRWRPFTASQVVSPAAGFIWAATTRVAALHISGFDRYSSGTGQMRWRLLGAIPVMSAAGPDVARSAAGRLAAESVFVPTAYKQATWAPGPDADTTLATWHIDDHVETVQLRVAADGALREISMSRWGNPSGAPYGRHPFGVMLEDHTTFNGIRIPSAVRAFWEWGTDRQTQGEFFRARITSMIAL
jgi:hypothetical protein